MRSEPRPTRQERAAWGRNLIGYNQDVYTFGNLIARGIPRSIAVNANATDPSFGENDYIEVVSTTGSLGTVSWEYNGLKLTTNTAEFDYTTIVPLVGASGVNETLGEGTPFCPSYGDDDEARNVAAITSYKDTLKTGPSTSLDYSRGIGIWATFSLPSVTDVAILVGLAGDKPGSTRFGGDADSNEVPSDGVFLWFSSSDATNPTTFQVGVNEGSNHHLTNTGITAETDTEYNLHIQIGHLGTVAVWLNGVAVAASGNVDSGTTLGFMAGVQTLDDAADATAKRSIVVRHLEPYVAQPEDGIS